MPLDILNPQCFHIFHAPAQSDDTRDVGRSGFEPSWRIFQFIIVLCHGIHGATAQVCGFDGIGVLQVQHACTLGSKHAFVARYCHKIAINLFQVKRHVSHALCRIHQRHAAAAASDTCYLFHIHYRAEHVGYMGEGHQFCLFSDGTVNIIWINCSVRIRGYYCYFNAFFL